jgi:acyl carrier protein
MDDSEIYSRLTPIFRDVLDNEALLPTADLTASDVEEWDSLRHIRLVATVEKEFSVRFATTEIAALENVGQFVSLIQAKVGRRS